MSNPQHARTRRGFLREATAVAGGAAFLGTHPVFASLKMFAQDPPSACPPLPSGGTPFQIGQDQRPVAERRGVSSLTASQLTELRDAFTALRGLPPSDPRRWILQADMHASYCQQCTNHSSDIHYKWSFFPWHRAYLYYYERILGSLVNNLDNFRLPYWDWESVRPMPASYRTAPTSATPNSLWDQKREAGIAGGNPLKAGHGDMPVIQGLNDTQDFETFGGTASASGICEGNPHGIIHNDIGEASDGRDMGDLGFAARDPIFFAHHGNIDKLWSNWNSFAGATGLPANAYQNPTDSSFLNLSWPFYDETGKTVSIRAGDVLDHQANLRYVYHRPFLRIPLIYEIIRCRVICCRPDPEGDPFLQIDPEGLPTVESAIRQRRQTSLILRGVEISNGMKGTFEVFAMSGRQRILLGSFGIVGASTMEMKEPHYMTVLLDATKALPALAAKERPATLHLVGIRGAKAFKLQAKSAELRIQRSEK
jgi:hypothetical protein